MHAPQPHAASHTAPCRDSLPAACIQDRFPPVRFCKGCRIASLAHGGRSCTQSHSNIEAQHTQVSLSTERTISVEYLLISEQHSSVAFGSGFKQREDEASHGQERPCAEQSEVQTSRDRTKIVEVNTDSLGMQQPTRSNRQAMHGKTRQEGMHSQLTSSSAAAPSAAEQPPPAGAASEANGPVQPCCGLADCPLEPVLPAGKPAQSAQHGRAAAG